MGRLRDWYLAIIGCGLIAGGLYLAAAHPPDGSSNTEQAKQTNSSQQAKTEAKTEAKPEASPPAAPGGSTAPASSPPSSSANKAGTVTPAPPPTPSAAAPSTAARETQNAAPPAHDHSAANTGPATTPPANPPSANTASSPAPSSPTAAVTPANAAAVNGGDPVAGKLVFRKCQVCHSLEAGKNVLGPSLAGIVGHKSGAVANYDYSPAMKSANLTWDAKTLDAYLDDPQKAVPGNKMPFPGLKTSQDRSDVIAFLAAPGGATAVQPSAPAATAAPPAPSAQAQQNVPVPNVSYVADARYTLRSGIAEGRMVYIGV